MLCIKRKNQERTRVVVNGVSVWVQVLEIGHGWVRLGVSAPPDVPVAREELLPEAERYEATRGAAP